jgi:hypothetical protein
MTVTTLSLTIGNTEALNTFDSVTHIGFGDNNTPTNNVDTALGNELLRVTATDITKDTVNNTYKFTGRIPITQFNSNTVYELGLFDDPVSGNMAGRIVLATGLTKTSDDELVFIIEIEVNTINS